MFISLGYACEPALKLRNLGLRTISLPFDWMFVDCNRLFEYINDLINTNFKNFTNDLTYNWRDKVISKHYNYAEFFHYDLIKNTTLNRPEDSNKNLLEMMNNRGKRFMDIISNEKNEVIFVCEFPYRRVIKDGKLINKKLYEDMLNFDTNNNIKCKFKVFVYLKMSNIESELYTLSIPTEFETLKHFIFDTYNSKMNFELMLKKNNLL